jgi:hypothetical protein
MQEARSFAPPPRGGFALSWGITLEICALVGKKIHAKQKTYRVFRQFGCRLTIASSTQRAVATTIKGEAATSLVVAYTLGVHSSLRFCGPVPGSGGSAGTFSLHLTDQRTYGTPKRLSKGRPSAYLLNVLFPKLLRVLFSATSTWAESDGLGIRRLAPMARHALYNLAVLTVLALVLEA